MIGPAKLQRLLFGMGWASIIAYVITIIVEVQLKYATTKTLVQSDELAIQTLYLVVFGFVIESPLGLAPALLCLMAATYMKSQRSPEHS